MKLTEILLKSNINEVADLLCKSGNMDIARRLESHYGPIEDQLYYGFRHDLYDIDPRYTKRYDRAMDEAGGAMDEVRLRSTPPGYNPYNNGGSRSPLFTQADRGDVEQGRLLRLMDNLRLKDERRASDDSDRRFNLWEKEFTGERSSNRTPTYKTPGTKTIRRMPQEEPRETDDGVTTMGDGDHGDFLRQLIASGEAEKYGIPEEKIKAVLSGMEM